MKRFIIGLFLVAGIVSAGEPASYIKISASNVPTNAISTNVYGSVVGSTTTVIPVSGTVLGVVVDFSGATSPDIDLDLVTASGRPIPISRNILSIDDIAADAEYDVRNSATTTAGVDFTDVSAPIVLIADEVRLLVSDANKTNINVDVYMLIK
jgi:hypothetical protein